MTEDQKALLVYIEELNAKARERMRRTPGLWCSEWHTDMEVWARSGITTVDEFNAMWDAEYEREVRKSAMY